MGFDRGLKDEIRLNEEGKDEVLLANYGWAKSDLQTVFVHLQNQEQIVHFQMLRKTKNDIS